jgi:hypothetical protein
LDEIRFWPHRLTWAKDLGWLEVEDPISGEWHQVHKDDAPRLWVQIAMRAHDVKVKAARSRRGQLPINGRGP